MVRVINNRHIFGARLTIKTTIYVCLIFKLYHRRWFLWPIARDVYFPHFDLFESH